MYGSFVLIVRGTDLYISIMKSAVPCVDHPDKTAVEFLILIIRGKKVKQKANKPPRKMV